MIFDAPKPLLTDLQREIYGWLFTRINGATDEELEISFPKAAYYGNTTLRKRRGELVSLGLVRDSGTKRPNSRGTAFLTVWEVNTAR